MPTNQTLEAAQATEVFRFANVRNPQLPKVSLKGDRFITHSFFGLLTTSEKNTIRADGNILHEGLLLTVSAPNPRTAAEEEVTKFRNGTNGYVAGNYYGTKTALYVGGLFTRYDLIQEKWQEFNGFQTGADFISKVEAILGTTVATHLVNAKKMKVRIWDNIMSSYIIADIAPMRDQYIWCLRILHAMEKISPNPANYTIAGVQRLYRAIPVLPKPVFPLPKIANSLPETTDRPDVPGADEKAEALEQYQNHLLALREIRNLVALRRAQRKSTLPAACQIPFDDEPLPEEYRETCTNASVSVANHYDFIVISPSMAGLSTSTIDLIKLYMGNSIVNVYVPFILQRLRQEAFRWAGKSGLDNGRVAYMLVGKNLIPLKDLCRDRAEVIVCDPLSGATLPVGSGYMKPVGIADYLTIKQILIKYAEGEIAHVENIMATEIKRRTHRDLLRNEVTTSTEESREGEEMRDTQSTERFSVQSEASQVVQSDQQFNVNGSIGLSGGTPTTMSWQVNVGAGYATSNSQQNASTNGSSYAKDVVERAVSRVIEKTRTLRQTTVIRELEDTSEHGFDNKLNTTAHIVGQYHWLDKYYLCKIVNHGKRMMFEFMIPEPAAFHIYTKAVQKPEGVIIEKPIAPDDESWDEPLSSPEQLNYDNYDRWAARYNVQEMPAPPQEHVTVGKTITTSLAEGNETWALKAEVVTLPSGYQAANATVRFIFSTPGTGNTTTWFFLTVGKKSLHAPGVAESENNVLDLDDEVGELPITLTSRDTYVNVAILIKCEPTPNTITEWQLRAYTAIIQAYEIKLDEYSRKVTAMTDSAIKGQNPALNRAVERDELKRGCLELLTDQKWNAFDAMRNWQGANQYPEFSNSEARGEGAYVKFFEQSFEWMDMNYVFYPYYWGRKRNWVTIKNMEDPDPIFTRFLQSGFARVIVPVRPGFEEAILHYCDTGHLWNGEGVPTIDDELFVSIIDEIREQEEIVGDENLPVVGDPWIIKIPTNLVRLNASVAPALPDFSEDLLEE